MADSRGGTRGRTGQILELLEQSRDWRSGEEISGLLGISRAAVAKHVGVLRKKGCIIESLTRRGYRLLVKNEALKLADIQKELRTKLLGRAEWRFFSEIGSTSNEAVRLAVEALPQGSVLVAEHQTMGHGRKGKSWFSAPRGLQFSVILRPSWPVEDLSRLCALGTIAVAEAIAETTGLESVVKAPNDILLGRVKVAGILAETGWRGGEPDWAVLGVGCNVNALAGEFPPELRDKVTSILAHGGRPVSRVALLAAILNRLDSWYAVMEAGGSGCLRVAWEQRAGQTADSTWRSQQA